MKTRLVIVGLLLVLVISVAGPGTAMGQDREQALRYQELIGRSVEHIQAAELEEAIATLKEAVELMPEQAVAYYNLACVYSLQENSDDALDYLEEATENGFFDAVHMRSDPDLNYIREEERYKAIIKKYSARPEVRLPEGYDAQQIYPLLVFLHGAGDSAENMMNYLKRNSDVDKFITLCIPGSRCVGPGRFVWDAERDMDVVPVEIEKAMLRHSVDAKRVYVAGFSMGASFSFLIGAKSHKLVTGIIPMGGQLPQSPIILRTIKNGNFPPVVIVHGRQDEVIPFRAAQQASAALVRNGVSVDRHYFEGGHVFPEDFRKVLNKALAFIDGENGLSVAIDPPADTAEEEKPASDEPPGEDF